MDTKELIRKIEMPGNGRRPRTHLGALRRETASPARVRDQGNFHAGINPFEGVILRLLMLEPAGNCISVGSGAGLFARSPMGGWWLAVRRGTRCRRQGPNPRLALDAGLNTGGTCEESTWHG